MALALAGLVAIVLLFAGCASTEAQIDRGRSLRDVKRFFVVSNLNDNHALDHHIAASLTSRGRQAGVGPLTMMPDDTQAVIGFQDHWGWDFGEHLVYLRLSVRDPRSNLSYATATFVARVPLREPPAATLDRLVGQLLEK